MLGELVQWEVAGAMKITKQRYETENAGSGDGILGL